MHRKETYNLAIGLTLQELHAERKMPREKIAEALEISELTVTRVEHGAEIMTLSASSCYLICSMCTGTIFSSA